MFCSNCGKEVPKEVNFCTKCGAKIQKGVQRGTVIPEEIEIAVSKVGQEIEKALSKATKEIHKAFQTAKESISKSAKTKIVVCPHCKEKNIQFADFCRKCGKKIK